MMMTLEQTRQLGIEFERKLQTIDPTEKILTKVDTEDIYAYLNMYQELYIKLLYTLDQLADSDTRPSNRILDILLPLIKTYIDNNPIKVDDYKSSFTLPLDYWLYSSALVDATGTYKNSKSTISIPCILLKQLDLSTVIDTGFDKDRIIRTPIVDMKNPNPEVIHDRYTSVQDVVLKYVRKPNYFSVLTNTPCELPMTCFEDLVNGAVDLYFNDKYKLAIASAAARHRAKKDDDDDNTTTA